MDLIAATLGLNHQPSGSQSSTLAARLHCVGVYETGSGWTRLHSKEPWCSLLFLFKTFNVCHKFKFLSGASFACIYLQWASMTMWKGGSQLNIVLPLDQFRPAQPGYDQRVGSPFLHGLSSSSYVLKRTASSLEQGDLMAPVQSNQL